MIVSFFKMDEMTAWESERLVEYGCCDNRDE